MQKNSHEQELDNARTSIEMLNSNLEQQHQRKVSLLDQLGNLQDRIRKEGVDLKVQKFVSFLEKLKTLERQESKIQSDLEAKRSSLEAEVSDLEEKIATGCDEETLSHDLEDYLNESLGKLDSAKKELAARLRAIVLVKHHLDDMPSQSELIQYESRSSELNAHIQEKLQHTRKFYATYNTLLEIKDLMLKEISILNSISSQFQDAIASPAGRMKLLESMEGIVKSSQQKLEKVQVGLQQEQKVYDALKERYTAAVADQRQSYSLLKAFQEECARNERLKSQTSV